MNLYYESSNELMHYGRQGMKWYQHIYGAAKTVGGGIKRGAKKVSSSTKSALAKYKQKRKEKQEANARKHPKSIKDMTDTELANGTKRLQAEKNYLDLQRNVSSLSPKKQSAGKKFMETAMNSVITPAMTNVGKNWLEKKLKTKFGLDTESELDALTEAANKATQMKRKLQAEDWIADRNKKKEAAKAEEAANTKAKTAAQKQVDAYNDRSGEYHMKGSNVLNNTFGTKKSTALSSMSLSSEEFVNKAYKGERYTESVVDRMGNTVLSESDWYKQYGNAA